MSITFKNYLLLFFNKKKNILGRMGGLPFYCHRQWIIEPKSLSGRHYPEASG
jgi:hypothetical protein